MFCFNDTATTEIYTLSLHDALPISRSSAVVRSRSSLMSGQLAGKRRMSSYGIFFSSAWFSCRVYWRVDHFREIGKGHGRNPLTPKNRVLGFAFEKKQESPSAHHGAP